MPCAVDPLLGGQQPIVSPEVKLNTHFQNEQLTADRSNFWKVLERTNPSKLYLFSESELRDCQDYFSKVQSDPTVPANELIMAAERLILIRSEVDVRHGDANYRRAQRLAWSAIGLAMRNQRKLPRPFGDDS